MTFYNAPAMSNDNCVIAWYIFSLWWSIPIPGSIWNSSLTSRSTAVVTSFTFGNAYATAWTPVEKIKSVLAKYQWVHTIQSQAKGPFLVHWQPTFRNYLFTKLFKFNAVQKYGAVKNQTIPVFKCTMMYLVYLTI